MRRMRAAAGLAAAAIAFSSCGLENVPELPPPDAPDALASDATPLFQVVNHPTTVPSDWFFELKYGFELYYKFYTRDQAKEENLADRDQLLSNGYRRVNNAVESLSAQVLPLISINVADQNTEFDVTLDFSQPVASEAQYNGIPSRIIDVRRGVEQLGEAKTFAKEDLDGADLDVSEIWATAVSDGEIHLAMYAMTYGMYNFSSPLYSQPRYLGFMIYHGLP